MSDPVYDVCVVEDAEGRSIYAARETGLYRSSDDGMSWTWLYAGLAQPVSATTAVAANGHAFVAAAVNGGVLTSSDGGYTWHSASLTRPVPLVTALALLHHGEADQLVLAASFEDGMFRSTNRGLIWSPCNYGLCDPAVLALTVAPDGFIYAGTNSGVYVSLNGGRAWRASSLTEAGAVMRLACTADGTVFAAVESGDLYFSRSAGQTWLPLVIPWVRTVDDPPRMSVDPYNGMCLRIEAADHWWVTATHGETWQAQPLPDWAVRLNAWSMQADQYSSSD